MPSLMDRIRRGKPAIFETRNGDGIEEIILTGPPRIDKETGDLLIGFRRPDDTLDFVVVCGDTEVERPISEVELKALLEGLKQAINECGSRTDNLLDIANRYVEFCKRNKLPKRILELVIRHFPSTVQTAACFSSS